MLKYYYNTGPNPTKVTLFLEEAGLEYDPIPLETRKGEQFTPEYLTINPNAKAPSIVDGDVTVFDSSAILLYLAEKTGRFLLPDTAADRGQLLSWLMFVASGVGPYSGQAVHFQRYAPERKCPTPSNATGSKRSVISTFSTADWRTIAMFWATAIRSSIWRSGAGRI